MDAYEATRIVFSRIQNLDPDNASRIMGLLLIQDHGEKEMIRLAFGPEALVHSVIVKARKELGLASASPPTPSTPLSASPFFSRQSSSASSRILTGNIPPAVSVPNPSSVSASWCSLSDLQSHEELGSPNCYGGATVNSDFFYPQPDLSLSPVTGDGVGFPSYGGCWGGSVHRRSCSVSDACLSSDDPATGFGWKPCLYYARGYCKNGASCRFLHADPDGVGSPTIHEMTEFELFRSKSAHLQRLASAKTINLCSLLQQTETQRVAAALLSGEELQKLGRSRLERCDFPQASPACRQIYLTFPADSTFREEDVSNYFSIFGPVQDVRIPYQQKRMFGFVTFVYADTVRLILAKGNPHFVCDARVLVKPYKEKSKLPDKYTPALHFKSQEMESCGAPADSFDLPSPGGGVFYNSGEDVLWRRKMEEQALELQSRRLMNLQLLDVKHHHRALSTGSPHRLVLPSSFHATQLENRPGLTRIASDQKACEVIGNGQESNLEHNLPDSPFASPTKASSDYFSVEPEREATNKNSSPTLLPTSSLDMSPFQSFNCQVSRFTSGHGAIGMFSGNGGSTFPVGI